ncbi:hypothetical protein [Herbiconiux sp. L3-i23]|uniref:hypothetical protein n=1 Tax=Herbiconiux sp. L3-i23 TaxID=2905871 RepID=UPI00206A0BE1|nr:hypothetical protein [Herbiconiux sp. L3-i23]BDI24127.1 hypothetical protein L3i23_29030 [Herbiconiux sp. L3-i23]
MDDSHGRDRLQRSRRGRRAAVVVGGVAAGAGILAGGAFLLAAGPLAGFPVERFDRAAVLTLDDGHDRIGVAVDEGWARLGLLPDPSRVLLASPDDRMHVTLSLNDRGDDLPADLSDGTEPRWRTETLSSGARVQHTTRKDEDGGGSILAVVEIPGHRVPIAVVAEIRGTDPDGYRTEVAAIVASMEVTP